MAVAVALASAGCGSGGDEPSPSGKAAATTAGAASPLRFSSPAIGGGTVDGAAFQGRPTLLWFWAPW